MSAIRNQNFHDAYITGNQKELDRLWREEAPSTLIKFYPAKYESNGVNFFLEHLETKTIWLSSPTMFNDPFDCVYNFDYKIESTKIGIQVLKLLAGEKEAENIANSDFWIERSKAVFDKFKDNMFMIHRKYEDNKYVGCFSEPENLFSKIMWAHYANSHSGVCAEYEYSSVNEICEFGCIPIKYTDEYNRRINTITVADSTAEFLKLIYNKATEWAYEKEWRVVHELENDERLGINVPCALPKNIYLGCKISNQLKHDILNFCYGKEIGVFQMKLKPGTFCLNIDRVL